MKTIAVVPHLGKASALEACRQANSILSRLGSTILASRETISAAGLDNVVPSDESDIRARADAAVVMGGDGAMLAAARSLSPYGVPLLGVNTGHLGFLTQVEARDMEYALTRLAGGEYSVQTRSMLAAEVHRGGECVSKLLALNDIVITKSALARIITLATYIADQLMATYRADGLIIATPTGSTAYSLSAGGPIVNPSLNALIVTPICAHTLNARAIVASGDDIIRIELDSYHSELMLTADGQVGVELQPRDSIVVAVADHSARLLDVMGRGFYDLVQNRIREGRL